MGSLRLLAGKHRARAYRMVGNETYRQKTIGAAKYAINSRRFHNTNPGFREWGQDTRPGVSNITSGACLRRREFLKLRTTSRKF